jgi:uncharacterized protein YceH (UPF0502 family)
VKYRHLAEDALGVGRDELSVLAVLLLRGPQTPGELKQRSERMARLESLADVERVLETLGERGYARRLHRRPGQKEDRFEHLLGEQDGDEPEPEAAEFEATGLEIASDGGAPATIANDGGLAARVAALEADVAALRAEVEALREI